MKKILLSIILFIGLIPNLKDMCLKNISYAIGQTMYNEWQRCDSDEFACEICGKCFTIGSNGCQDCEIYCYNCSSYHLLYAECNIKENVFYCLNCQRMYWEKELKQHNQEFNNHHIVTRMLYCFDCNIIEYDPSKQPLHYRHNAEFKNIEPLE